MLMHNPPHPGAILRELCLEPLGLSVTEAARALGVSRKTLSSLVNGRAGVSPEMATRLSIAFGTSAESWMNQQTVYDLWRGANAFRRESRALVELRGSHRPACRPVDRVSPPWRRSTRP